MLKGGTLFATILSCMLLADLAIGQTCGLSWRINLAMPFPRTLAEPDLVQGAKKVLSMKCLDSQRASYGDSVFFRRPGTLDIGAETNRILTSAWLSQDGGFAAEIVQKRLAGMSPREWFLGSLTALYVEARSSGVMTPLFDELLRGAFAMTKGRELPMTDLNFLSAVREAVRGNTAAAVDLLTGVIADDEGFYQAHFARLMLQLDHARVAEATRGRACLHEYTRLFGYLNALVELAPCARHAAHLTERMKASVANSEADAPYLAGIAYLSTVVQNRAAFDAARESLNRMSSNPRCRALISRNVDGLASLHR